METKGEYPYISIQLIDGEIKVVCNKRDEPNQDLIMFDDVFKRWQQNHKIFEFANQDEIDKVFYYLTKKLGFKEYETKLKQDIQVTCVEIKNGVSYFKEPARVFGGKDDAKFWCDKPIQEGHPDFKYVFKNYKKLLDHACDERRFYGCSQAGNNKPDCLDNQTELAGEIISIVKNHKGSENELFKILMNYKITRL